MPVMNTTYPGAIAPPPGVVPDLDNPSASGNDRAAILVCLSICVALVTVMFAIRSWVKIRITRTLLVEDAICVIAWISLILYSLTCYMMIRYGLGYHTWDLSVYRFSQLLKWLYAGSVVYCPAAYFTKVTLLLLIARVFTVKRWVTYSIYTFIIVLLITYLPIQILKMGICQPLRAYWDANVQGHCFNQRKLFLSDLSVAVLTDVVILIVPIVLAWRLQFGWRKKVKISLLLGAGGIATGATVYRMYVAILFMHSKDVAGDFALQGILVLVELTIGLVCACLPSVNILATHHHLSCFPHSSWADSETVVSEENKRRHKRWIGSISTTGDSSSKHRSSLRPSLMHSIPSNGGDVSAAGKPMSLNFETKLTMFSGATGADDVAQPPAIAAQVQAPQSPRALENQGHWSAMDEASLQDEVSREGSPQLDGVATHTQRS